MGKEYITHYQLPITNYPLPITNYPLIIPVYVLNAKYSPETAYF
ncbi:MAG: hypothetical protein ACKO99_18600 [Dolichospermum sp.]